MKILIIGGTGMLGHIVSLYFKEKGYTIITTGLKGKNKDYEYDAYNNMEYIEEILKIEHPQIVINCSGILNKAAEDNKCMAIKVNSLLPHYLDKLSQEYNFKFIQISTDCVFDGKKGDYKEKDYKDAISFYGKTKALGEIENNQNLTLRTSIIGPDINKYGIGLFNWFMNQSNDIEGYSNVFWSGVTTLQLAKNIEDAILANLVGLYHVVNNSKISKYELLNLFKKIFSKNINIKENKDIFSDKSIINTSNFDFNIPSYESMIIEMKQWIDDHENIYDY